MGVISILNNAGCLQIIPLNDKYVGVRENGFEFYLRTEKPRWDNPLFRTIFIYGYDCTDTDLFLEMLRKLREKTQVVVYAQDELFSKRLAPMGFKETNRFVETKVRLSEEIPHYVPNDLSVSLIRAKPTPAEEVSLKELSHHHLEHVRKGLANHKGLFTWFDSQYCPTNFHVTFEEQGVAYALIQRGSHAVGFAKLLLPVAPIEETDEIEIELEFSNGCTIQELRGSLFSTLAKNGYSTITVRKYEGNPEPSHTSIHREPIFIMEYGTDAMTWDTDQDKTNPLEGPVWKAKRNE